MTTSREVRALVGYVTSTGLPFRVTSTYRPPAPGARPRSYHEMAGTDGNSLAVDLAGVAPGTGATSAAQMFAVYRALLDVAAQLAELIYSGPGAVIAVKNGRRVDGAGAYGPVTWADHRDHVHVAVPRGTFLSPRTPAGGTGPPTVTATRYPEGEDVLTRHDVDIPALDGQGRGWFMLEVPADRVVSIVVQGSYPPVDGYWELPAVGRQARGEGKTCFEITEATPNQAIRLSVWAIE